MTPLSTNNFATQCYRLGYPLASIPSVKFRIESQETADRDYGESWAEAMEMP
jgi:hypothetical protein